MRLFSLQLRGWVPPANAFFQFFADSPNAFWLDREFNRATPFSVIGAGLPTAEPPSKNVPSNIQDDLDLPFDWRPGLVGFFEYEGTPRFLDVDRAMVFDHENRKMYLVGNFETSDDFERWCNAAFLRFGLIGGELAAHKLQALKQQAEAQVTVQLRHSSEQYLQMINEAQERIASGDVYQICLTNRIHIEHAVDPLVTFLKLRESNPAPYAAYIRIAEITLVCSSPEQFLQVHPSGLVSTKPIKGTRPRSKDAIEDAALAEELRTNEKERAENLMIVDLMRNDIGRVTLADSVKVSKLFEIESYSTVHQLVSTIEGQLADGESASTALTAAFPGGSMTGAPKIRAMEIIKHLEKGPRGVYSGVLGYLGFNGSADFGMIIRTIVFQGDTAYIGVGGGITSDSDPLAELEETKLKAKALLKALNAPDPWG
jgi:aminodeoxychorismate synthase component I